MPRITYNQFYKGVAQDDFLTNWPGVIEQKNITGLQTGYGVTLWPASTKIRTIPNTETITAIWSNGDDTEGFIGTASGKIYNLHGADAEVAHYDFGAGYKVAEIYRVSSNIYFQVYDSVGNAGDITVFRVDYSDFRDDSATNPPVAIEFTDNDFSPMSFETSSYFYIGEGGQIFQFTRGSSPVQTDFAIFRGFIIGMTYAGTRFNVYSRAGGKGLLAVWDGVSNSIEAQIELNFTPVSVVTSQGIDYVCSDEGDIYVVSGFSYQRLSESRLSNKLEDNSQYLKQLFFSKDLQSNRMSQATSDVIYFKSKEDQPGIYSYDNIIEGLAKGFHKTITQNHLFEDYTTINDIFYQKDIDSSENGLYIGGESTNTTSVDYIPIDTLNTAKDGYFITEVFSGGTSFQKKGVRLNIWVSNTGWSNFCKIYKRIDGWDWVEIKTINKTGIHREELNKPKDNFIDIQFKVELHNESGLLIDCPILHELTFDYEPTEKS